MEDTLYSRKLRNGLVFKGTYAGYTFFVISYGIYPAVFIKVKKINDAYFRHRIKKAHGGINYYSYADVGGVTSLAYHIGWDYTLASDYNPIFERSDYTGVETNEGRHKWQLHEIVREALDVIDELINLGIYPPKR